MKLGFGNLLWGWYNTGFGCFGGSRFALSCVCAAVWVFYGFVALSACGW